jgi:hypothetical protein
MLKPEDSEKQLKQWTVEERDDWILKFRRAGSTGLQCSIERVVEPAPRDFIAQEKILGSRPYGTS